jgi:ketosteroid isomerase-like protein
MTFSGVANRCFDLPFQKECRGTYLNPLFLLQAQQAESYRRSKGRPIAPRRLEKHHAPFSDRSNIMQPQAKTIIDLEKKFWQSMVDNDADTAIGMLAQQSLMVSSHGAMKFGHDEYRKMAEQGSWVLKSYELSDMQVVFPNDNTAVATYHVKQIVTERDNGNGNTTQEMNDTSTWVKDGNGWKCVMHTETPAEARPKH